MELSPTVFEVLPDLSEGTLIIGKREIWAWDVVMDGEVPRLEKPVTLGVPTELIRGDIFFWGSLMAAALIAGIPVAIVYNLLLRRFVAGITGGAIK